MLLTLVAVPEARASAAISEDGAQEDLEQLDTRFQEVLNRYLREMGKDTSAEAALRQLPQVIDSERPVLEKLAVIRASLPALLESLRQTDVTPLLRFLYESNDTATIQRLADEMSRGNMSRQSAVHYFLLARYYYERQNWSGVTAAISSSDLGKLPLADRHYAYLLYGYALQQQRKHRKAYEYYKKIPPQSPYYAYAKLNEGTAYLRQGWWTEAHMEFKRAIESLGDGDDLKNRLFVVLGYSQLHYEFYRDARKTLRNVSLSSPYTNKALMGLGLSAAHQNDFAGALNAFKILVAKTPKDVNVDEAMLLLAKAHEEVKEPSSAASAYQNAIGYYEGKRVQLSEYQTKLRVHDTLDFREFEEMAAEIYGRQQFVPGYFHQNYDLLLSMSAVPVSSDLSKELKSLREDYRDQLKRMIESNIEMRRAMLDSYISQAKLGMAQLYDQR